jgi:hypothetical protein
MGILLLPTASLECYVESKILRVQTQCQRLIQEGIKELFVHRGRTRHDVDAVIYPKQTVAAIVFHCIVIAQENDRVVDARDAREETFLPTARRGHVNKGPSGINILPLHTKRVNTVNAFWDRLVLALEHTSGVRFLQLFKAEESPVLSFVGVITSWVQTQLFSNIAPPAVCIFPISYHVPA